MDYSTFRYYFPPRPEIAFPSEKLDQFDNGQYIGQPKLNGSCCLTFLHPKELHVYNRHKARLDHKMNEKELMNLHSGKGWMVLLGEYMNKACKDEHNKLWNIKYCIFDLLVYDNQYLVGSTTTERQNLLSSLFKKEPAKPYLDKISENVYQTQNIETNFKKVYDDITIFGMYEGLVLKNKNAKLVTGFREKSDTSSQIKSRKETKNYSF
jgi:hypothetical protein